MKRNPNRAALSSEQNIPVSHCSHERRTLNLSFEEIIKVFMVLFAIVSECLFLYSISDCPDLFAVPEMDIYSFGTLLSEIALRTDFHKVCLPISSKRRS